MATIEDITLREKYKHLEIMFNNTMHTRAQFKQMNKILVNILNHSRGLFEQSKLFSEKLQSFSFTSDSKEPDPLITICGVQYLRFSQIQLSLANQMNDILITPLRNMMKDELNEDVLKELHRNVIQKRDVYNSFHRTIEKDKKKSKDSAKLNKELKTSKEEFEASIDEFQSKLRDINVSCRFDFIQRLAAFLFANKGCYQQGMVIVEQIGKDLLDIMKDMQEAKASYIANKDLNNKNSLFINQMHESGLERQGYIYKLSNKKVPTKKHWNMKWFQLKNGVLSWFSKWKDTQPSGNLDLKLCSIKIIADKPNTFEITQASPEYRLTLRGLTELDYKEWIKGIQNAISHELSKEVDDESNKPTVLESNKDNNQLLTQLYEINESNMKCADCGAPNPEWVSINIGCIICIQCSGIHRSLGSHISKVRSLKMDSLRNEVKTFLFNIGNNFVNCIFESNTSKSEILKPTQESSELEKTKYIKKKYIRKKFIKKRNNQIQDKESIIKIIKRDILKKKEGSNENEVWNDIKDFLTSKPSVQNSLRKFVYIYFNDFLKSFGDELIIDDSNKTLFHLLAEKGNSLLVSFLVLNGHPFGEADSEGRIPLHYAVLSGSLECCQLLANKHFIKLCDKNDKSPFNLAVELKSESSSQIIEFFNEFDSSPSNKTPNTPGQIKKKDKTRKNWTLTNRIKESRPSVTSFFSKRGSDKRTIPPSGPIEISRPTTFDGTEQAKELKTKSRDSISIIDKEILLKSLDNGSSKRVKNFIKRKSLSVPSSPNPNRLNKDEIDKNKGSSNSHIRQESLDKLGSNEFWNKIETKLKNLEDKDDTVTKTRLKRSMTVTSDKKIQSITTQFTSKDDNMIPHRKNRVPSWSKDLTPNLLLPLEIDDLKQKKEKEPKSCPAKVLPPFRPDPISEEVKEVLKIKVSTSSPPPDIPPKGQNKPKEGLKE